MDWISVKDKPLIIRNERNEWECTDAGMKTFVACVPFQKQTHPNEDFWWIRLCVMEDEIGLCVVGDDDNEPAGWNIDDITHYFHLPEPPKL